MHPPGRGACAAGYLLHAEGPLGFGAVPGSCGGGAELTVTG